VPNNFVWEWIEHWILDPAQGHASAFSQKKEKRRSKWPVCGATAVSISNVSLILLSPDEMWFEKKLSSTGGRHVAGLKLYVAFHSPQIFSSR